MRIAVVAPPWVPVPPVDYGGTELIVDILCRGYHKAGHAVTLFCSGDSTCPVDRIFSNTHSTMPPDKHAEHRHFALALKEINSGSFDLVHAHLEGFIPYGQLISAPLLCTVHVPMTPARLRLLSDISDARVVAVSDDHAASLPCPSTVIHHGIEIDRYRFSTSGGEYLLWLGNVMPEKGLEEGLEVARETGLILKVAGPVSKQHSGWWQSLQARHAAYLDYLGSVKFDAKIDLLGGARALLMLVNWREPFGLVAVEAMACGTPVIASSHGALPELVEPGVTGYLCGSVEGAAEAIHQVASLDRQAIRQRAAERFSSQRMVDENLALINRLVD